MVKFIKNCFSNKDDVKLHEQLNFKKLEKVNNYFELLSEGNNRIFIDIDGDLDKDFIKSNRNFDELDNKIIMELMKLKDVSILSSSHYTTFKCDSKGIKDVLPKLSYRITFINEYCSSFESMREIVEQNKTKVIKDLLDDIIDVRFNGSSKEKNYLNIDSSVYREGKMRAVNAYKYDQQPERINKLIMGEVEDTIIGMIPENCKLIKSETKEKKEEKKEVKKEKEKVKEKVDRIEVVETIDNNDVLIKILEGLNESRFDSYHDWFKIACIFVNEDYNLSIFDKFSKKGSNYNKTSNDNIIKKLKKNEKGYRISTLYFMLKEDNYTLWKQLQAERKDFWEMMEKFNHTDLAQLYFNMYPDKYIYSNKTWYELNDSNIYKEVIDYKDTLFNNITLAIQQIIIEQRNLILPNDKYYMEKNRMVKNNYNAIGNSNFKKGVIESLCGFYYVDNIQDKLNRNSDLIAFTNKVYDIKLGSFRDIKPTDYISITTKYDAPEQSNLKYRKKINELLYSIFEDNEIVNYWLTTIGLSLFTNKFESLYIHTGTGRNGKGVLSDSLEMALGEYYKQADNSLLTGETKGATNPTLANARYTRLLMLSEPDDSAKDYKLKTSLVKSITGGDTISVRDLYKSNIEYKPLFSVVLLCNKKPAIDRVDKAMEERLKVIHYPFTFVDTPKLENERKRDNSLKDLIKNDINYRREFILLLLESAQKSIKLSSIKLPKKIQEKNDEYFNENNPVKEFLEDKFTITNDNKDRIKASVLFNLYNDEEYPDLSLVKFSEALILNGINKIKDNKDKCNYYVGLKLK